VFFQLQKKLSADHVMSREATRNFYAHAPQIDNDLFVFGAPVAIVLLPMLLPFEPYRDGAVANWMFTVFYNIIAVAVIMTLFTRIFLNLVFDEWTRREFITLLVSSTTVFMIATWAMYLFVVFPIPFSSVTMGSVAVITMLTTAWHLTPKEKRQTPEFRRQMLAANDTITGLTLFYFAYLFYGSAFVQLEGWRQAAFALTSPVLKLAFRHLL
jgi:hypothetical protein